MNLGRLVVEACMVVGLLVAGCHQSDSSVAQGPTTPKEPGQPQTAKTVEATKPPVPSAVTSEPAKKFVLRVDCGAFGPYKDKLGNTWAADQELGAGQTWGADDGSTMDREGVGITGTEIPRLYETERYSMGSYKFTVPNGLQHVEVLELHPARHTDGKDSLPRPGDALEGLRKVQAHSVLAIGDCELV